MKIITRYFLLLCLGIGLHDTIGAQTSAAPPTFRIVSGPAGAERTRHEEAIRAADMEQFRYKTLNNTIAFDDGTSVELFSAEYLQAHGTTIVAENYSDSKGPNYVNPILHLTEQGTLVASFPVASPK